MSDSNDAFANIDALEAVLRKEIAAIEAGDLAVLHQYEGDKVRLSEALERQLADNPQAISTEQLRGLKDLIQRNVEHLKQAMVAIVEVITEVSHIRDRHGIAGLYGRSGTKRDMHAAASKAVNKMF